MKRLEKLYAEKKELEQQKVHSMASSVMRRQKLNKIEQKIKYYERGDEISRDDVQRKLAEINELEKQIDRLSLELRSKKAILMNEVFGEGSESLKN